MARQVAARLEPIAEQMITAKDGDIAGDAGFVVQEFAKSDFEPVLWHELQTWCDRWCETPMQNVPISESSRRDGLVMALLYNRSWIMTPEKLRRIRSLARVKDSAVAAVHDMNSPEAPIHVGAVKDLGSVQIRIMYYSYSSLDLALNHLRLLPKETFVWDAYLSDPNDPDIKAVLTAVKSAILANGGVLTGEPNSQ
jgi:hypothetical protein